MPAAPIVPRRARRRPLFFAGAFLVVVATVAAAAAGYLAGVKHARWPLPERIVRLPFVRAYLFDARLQQLLKVIADQETDQGTFASIQDTTNGSLLSRRLFRPVTMFGQERFMYKPGLRKVMFRAGPPGFDHEIETEDTPAIRAALAGASVDYVTASYDAMGFRQSDPEVSRLCDSSVIFLGDSFTDGMWVTDSETFVSQYAALLRERSGAKVCPVNMGVNGYGPLEEAWVLEQHFERVGRPKAIFVMFFPNDVDADYLGVIERRVPDLDRKWEASLDYLRRIAAFARDRRTMLVLVAIPAAEQLGNPASRAGYQDILRRFAEETTVPLVDLLATFEKIERSGLYWSWDPHFTPHGHRIVAQLLLEHTVELLAPRVNR